MRKTTNDEDLAEAAANGDRDAYAALLSRHYDRLFAFAFRLTGQRAEAEDLTQDICVGLPKKLRGYRGEAKFTTWLYRIVVNAAHDRRRRAATHTKAAEGWGSWERDRRAANDDAREATSWLEAAMVRLKPELRDTAVLILAEDLTHGAAAEVLGVSEGTVSWRMSEIRKALRALAAEETT
ncbi:RNA polymerase sigma-70 factor (ECF subfamily) [Aliiruegeria haliotis]|uniref:RNA polymerase sigma-70 factor (ECF subfamily) n=1 Tax=Aliiruegeria haliotis TaxID=1280846 RepID=A0A2T0RZ32_9RHOB|nr:RNA polymerase sigma factor [Aliiruegeria haliotis]PRY26435.1 RNA polymerase sigma-70 factor (ECF subfamily) [Aliiruegeria haliotis]